MSRFFDEKFKELKRYVPGEQPRDKKYIKLNTNESPYPPSPDVIASIKDQDIADLRLYSDPECKALKQKLADRYGLKSENVFLSNGSDDILNFAFMAYCSDGKRVAFPNISYGFYKVYAQLHHSDADIKPLRSDFTVDVDDYCGINKTVVIANPNAPTGIALGINEIERIVSTNPDNVVVIDEAYVDFGAESCLPLLEKYDNLLIVRTFSKSRALAGARLGFALGNEGIISDLETLRFSTNPYSINRLTLKAGEAAIDSDRYFMDNCKRIEITREKTVDRLTDLGFSVIPSKANFIFVKHDSIDGEKLYLRLKDRGILIRHFSDPLICQYNRITIGSDEEMSALTDTVAEIIKEEHK